MDEFYERRSMIEAEDRCTRTCTATSRSRRIALIRRENDHEKEQDLCGKGKAKLH